MFSPKVIGEQVATGMIPTVKSAQVDPNASPLLEQASNQLDQRVTYLNTNDISVPGNVQQKLIRSASIAYTPGQDSTKICQALEGAYKQ
ncbi:hypothetical protein [Dictyobacter kobayashii]|nr:hypothetical protein [Dictyobacter kobayashii]